MIAKLEWISSNMEQNIQQLQTPTIGATINKKPTQQNHRLRADSSLSHQGTYMHFTGTKSLPISAVFEVQEMFSSHGSQIWLYWVCSCELIFSATTITPLSTS